MSKDLKDLIDTVEEKESSLSELEQEVKHLKEELKKLNFTIREQKLLIQEQENKLQRSEIFELPGDIRILKDMLVSQRLMLLLMGKKYQIFVLFLEVVTLTFVLQTSLSIGFLLSPPGMCVPSFI